MGGVVSHHVTEVEISCLPGDLPEYIAVDVSQAELGASIHLSDISLPSGVELTALSHDNDLAVLNIALPRATEADAPEASEEAGDEPREETAKGGFVADPAARLMRLQYGLMMGGVKAMTGMAGAAEEFVTSLAEEAELAESDRLGAVAERLPDSLISALRASLSKMEAVPGEVLDSIRRYARDGGD